MVASFVRVTGLVVIFLVGSLVVGCSVVLVLRWVVLGCCVIVWVGFDCVFSVMIVCVVKKIEY